MFDNTYILNVPRQSRAVELLIAEQDSIFDEKSNDFHKSVNFNLGLLQNDLKQQIARRNTFLNEKEEEEDEEEGDENNEELAKLQETKMPAFMRKEHKESTLPHKWETQKTLQISWCAGCQKIIAPTSKKKPVKIKACKTCEIPAHTACKSEVTAGCVVNGKKNQPDATLVGQEAPNIPNVTKDENGNSISLHDILNNGKKVVLFFYPMCKSFILI